jgi:hypothetical protein
MVSCMQQLHLILHNVHETWATSRSIPLYIGWSIVLAALPGLVKVYKTALAKPRKSVTETDHNCTE